MNLGYLGFAARAFGPRAPTNRTGVSIFPPWVKTQYTLSTHNYEHSESEYKCFLLQFVGAETTSYLHIEYQKNNPDEYSDLVPVVCFSLSLIAHWYRGKGEYVEPGCPKKLRLGFRIRMDCTL